MVDAAITPCGQLPCREAEEEKREKKKSTLRAGENFQEQPTKRKRREAGHSFGTLGQPIGPIRRLNLHSGVGLVLSFTQFTSVRETSPSNRESPSLSGRPLSSPCPPWPV